MPEKNEIFELYKQHRAGQDKYTYFLLATAAAAIAFAVQKTEGLPISWWLLPVAFAILSWGVSFFYGCRHLNWAQTVLHANYNLLQLNQGVHPEQPPHPQLAQAAVRGVESALDFNVKKAQFYAVWQFRALVLGALFFISWRVVEMVRITCVA